MFKVIYGMGPSVETAIKDAESQLQLIKSTFKSVSSCVHSNGIYVYFIVTVVIEKEIDKKPAKTQETK